MNRYFRSCVGKNNILNIYYYCLNIDSFYSTSYRLVGTTFLVRIQCIFTSRSESVPEEKRPNSCPNWWHSFPSVSCLYILCNGTPPDIFQVSYLLLLLRFSYVVFSPFGFQARELHIIGSTRDSVHAFHYTLQDGKLNVRVCGITSQ
jgi:hypothetical protein